MSEVLFWGATGQAKVLREALYGTDFRLVALNLLASLFTSALLGIWNGLFFLEIKEPPK